MQSFRRGRIRQDVKARVARQPGIHRVVQGAGYRAAFHPAWQARPECLHRALQPDLSRRGSERIPVRLVGGGAGDHRRMARALQRNHATRRAGKPAASALPRAFARRGNSSSELSTRRGAYRQFAKKKGNNGAETPDSAVTKKFPSCESAWSQTIRGPL